jgi:fructokinase
MNSSSIFRVAGLGELIWDLLPEGKQLGGAPSNFAYNAALLGDSAVIASRVGNDALGLEALARLRQMGISTDLIQTDRVHPTGTVGVSIDSTGEALFNVNENSAWDYLEFTPEWEELASDIDAVCFGTLGQREEPARKTIKRFLENTRPETVRIFDVNLRHSFFTRELLEDSLRLSTVVKLSADEVKHVVTLLDTSNKSELDLAHLIMDGFDIRLVAITRGSHGSLLVSPHEYVEHPGFRIKVADTIGAGDAFTAAMVHYYLRNASLDLISNAANRMGAWVATQKGATATIRDESLKAALSKLEERID